MWINTVAAKVNIFKFVCTQKKSHGGGTAAEIYTTVTLLSTQM